MTQARPEKKFVRSILPWAVAGGGLLLYLLTLNHWVSAGSIGPVSKVTGWDWRNIYTNPLQYVLTLPFSFLPLSIQPIALNLFSAVLAALTLGLLARSVILLPHDRTRDQRQREPDTNALLSLPHAWLPPVIAAVFCALQLTFWEHATSMTGEMIDLLVFAYVVRCLLEYRISEKESWLSKMALVYGIGVTNNWAMIAYFPLFLIALIWIKRLSFFKLGFILRMVGFGSAGLLLYFLLPAIDVATSGPGANFFEALKVNLRQQKGMTWNNPFARILDYRLDFFTVSLTSLLPIFLIGIRWPSFQGDISPAAYNLAIFMFRFLHLIFLVFAVWIFFDPPFSGRELGKGFIPFLSLYYLAALVTGYLSGYVLLVFGRQPERQWQRFKRSFVPVGKILVVAVWVMAATVPIGMIWKNWSIIRATNGPEMRKMAELMAQSLPEKDAIILSDDPYRLALLQGIYERMGRKNENLLLESTVLPYPSYHLELAKRYPSFEKVLLKPNTLPEYLNSAMLINFLDDLSKKHRIFYLHPSFGYYFERFYGRPNGLVWELKPYEKDQLVPPPLTSSEIAANQEFWAERRKQLANYFPRFLKTSPGMAWLGTGYSRCLNTWGVELQKLKRLDQAKEYFNDALALNPENVVAMVNLAFNDHLRQGGDVQAVESSQEIEKKLGQYRSWDSAIAQNGPFDELQSCFRIAQIYSSGGNYQQALLQFLRVIELSPKHAEARVGLIANYLDLGYPDKAIEHIKILRDQGEKLSEQMELSILGLEAKAYADKNDLQLAEELLLVLQSKRPNDVRVSGLLIQFYMHVKRYQDALDVVERELKKNPEDTGALLYKGALLIHLKEYEKAAATMDLFLENNPGTPAALMNRALANLHAKKYPEAKKDYETLERLLPSRLYAVYYGLGEVAYQTGQKEEAIKQYRRYMETAPPSEEYNLVTARMKELQSDEKKK